MSMGNRGGDVASSMRFADASDQKIDVIHRSLSKAAMNRVARGGFLEGYPRLPHAYSPGHRIQVGCSRPGDSIAEQKQKCLARVNDVVSRRSRLGIVLRSRRNID